MGDKKDTDFKISTIGKSISALFCLLLLKESVAFFYPESSLYITCIFFVLLITGATLLFRNRISRDLRTENTSQDFSTEEFIRNKSIFENSHDAISISNKNGVCMYSNNTFQTLYGYSEAELRGKPLLELVSSKERERIKEYIRQRPFNNDIPFFYEAIGIRKNGDEFPFENKVSTYKHGNETFTVAIVRDITERKKAERTLKENEERFRLLAEHSTDMISRHTPEAIYLYASPACERLLGYTSEELIGKSAFDFVFEEDVQVVDDSLNSILNHQVVSTTIFRAQRKDGNLIWLETTSEAIIDPKTSKVSEIHAATRDISERKLAEEALKKSEEKFMRIFDRAPVLISMTDFETGIYVDVNHYSLEFSGYTKDEVIGKRSVEVGWITAENRQLLVDTILKYGKIDALEMPFTTKNGSVIHAIINAEKIHLDGKDYLLSIATDITDRKKAEQALSESEKRFVNAIAATSDAIWEWNLATKETFFSPRWFQMLGFENQEFEVNMETMVALCHPEDFEIAIGRIRNCIDNYVSYSAEFRMKKKDGNWCWILGRGDVVEKDANGKALLFSGTNTDITERKLLEEELLQHRNHLESLVKIKTEEIEASNEEIRSTNEILYQKNEIIEQQNKDLNKAIEHLKETQAQLLQTEKMASLGVLTAGVAHEINNPLNYIMGAYEGLNVVLTETQQIKDENIPRLLQSLKTGVDRVSKIVKGLNQFSRNNEINNERCEIREIIENCLTILSKQHKDRIEIEKQFPTKAVVAIGNTGKLHQVFTNIISNAIQSINTTGVIHIEITNEHNQAVIEISDNGIGISNEHLSKITEPFFTTKDPGKGTGLGLAITYSIIKELNGSIEFQSELGSGTKVRVSLPTL